MRKQVIFSGLSVLFAAVVLFLTSSCARMDLLLEKLLAKADKETVVIDAPKASYVEKIVQVNEHLWCIEMNDNTINVSHSGDVSVEEINVLGVDEVENTDSTWTVTVRVESRSELNVSIKEEAKYGKVLRMKPDTVVIELPGDTIVKVDTVVVNPPTPPAPTVVRQYLKADTAMVYTWGENRFTADMKHMLRRVSEWSDGSETSDTIWNKTFQVGKTFPDICKGDLYTQCPAAHFKYSNGIDIFQTKTSEDGAFSITTRNGEFVFTGTYVCDSGVDQNWYGKVAFQEKDITVSFEDYSATYHFSFSSAFDAQWEEKRGEQDKEVSGHVYRYDATSCTSWNIAFNGMYVGKVQTEIIVRQY